MLGASNDFYNFIIDSYHVFKKEDGTTLKASWEMYKTYCDEAKVTFPFSQRIFKEEIKTNNNYEINDSYIKPEEVSKWLGLYDNKIVELHVENNEADITYNIDEDISYLEERGIVIKKITNKDDLKVVN